MKDAFLQENFKEINENEHNEKYEVFELQLPIGKIKHSFLKKEIAVKINGERYYDLTTPNSYGGPVVFNCKEDDKWELVDEFQRAFQTYCKENMIVSEYVRFHPRLVNVFDFICIYEVECIGEENRNEMKWLYEVLENEKIKEGIFNKEKKDRNIDFNICVGKRIWNEEIYKSICAAVEIGADADCFPAYRYKEINPYFV